MYKYALEDAHYAVDAWLFSRIEQCRKKRRDVLNGDEAIGTIELVLIMVVLIGLVIIFKAKIVKVLEEIMKKILFGKTTVYMPWNIEMISCCKKNWRASPPFIQKPRISFHARWRRKTFSFPIGESFAKTIILKKKCWNTCRHFWQRMP